MSNPLWLAINLSNLVWVEEARDDKKIRSVLLVEDLELFPDYADWKEKYL